MQNILMPSGGTIAVAWERFRKEVKWVASLDPKATPDEKDAIKKVCRCCLGQVAGPFVMLANVTDDGGDDKTLCVH